MENRHIPEILELINKGLEDCGVPEDSDTLRVIEEEVWAELEEERELGEITFEEEQTLYYNWINRHKGGVPFTDDDKLASPLGYFEQRTLFD